MVSSIRGCYTYNIIIFVNVFNSWSRILFKCITFYNYDHTFLEYVSNTVNQLYVRIYVKVPNDIKQFTLQVIQGKLKKRFLEQTKYRVDDLHHWCIQL